MCPSAPDRVDGFVPIGSYAALGDGRTVALVAEDGRIDWWPLPTLDSPPGFAAVLDPPDGGYVELAPEEPATVDPPLPAATRTCWRRRCDGVGRGAGRSTRWPSAAAAGCRGRS